MLARQTMITQLFIMALSGLSGHQASAIDAAGVRVATSVPLDYLKVEVNGELRVVKNDGQFTVVRGDKVTILEAVLSQADKKPSNVNLIGYENAKAPRPAEDRGFAVDTQKDLLEHWSEEKQGNQYRVKVFSGRDIHGQVRMQILPPSLRYAVLKINGSSAVLRENELVRVKASDQVKVEQVVTNVENDTNAVKFQIVPIASGQGLPGVKLFEIRFLRNDHVFAKIPLQVEGS